MMHTMDRRRLLCTSILWIARVTSIAALTPVLMILVGEPGTGPHGARAWIYLALFPVGFSAGYLFAWRWPVFGGCFSLVCMAASLAVLQRTLGLEPYLIWSILCVPGVLFVIAGWKLGKSRRTPGPAQSDKSLPHVTSST
jgi:hypothetical protein